MRHRSLRAPVAVAIVVALLTLGAAACSSGSSSSTPAPVSSGVIVSDPWAMNATMSQGNGAAFMTILNPTSAEDELLGGSVASTVAKEVQLHTVVVTGEMMKMTQVSSIPVPANGSVALKHGSYHLMLMELAGPLEVGSTFELTLRFKNAGEVKVSVPVEQSS